MIFAHLKQQWLAPGRSGLSSRILCFARSLRVLLFYRDHQALCQLDVYRNYVVPASGGAPFRHFSHRDYLARGLPARERVQCVLGHYHFEETTFNSSYKQAVYLDGGLQLWQHGSGDDRFAIRLELAPRTHAGGDLAISLIANGSCLHQLSFSWMEGALAGVAAPMVPFVARNQGRWADSGPAYEAFERAFPNNSPSFFCFAAMQGVAQSVGMELVVAIKCAACVRDDAGDAGHPANAYDGFWKVLGGVETPGHTWRIGLPFYLKPLADMPSKHRKRAAQRREYWRAIGDAARSALQRHLLHARAHHEHAAPVREPAEA